MLSQHLTLEADTVATVTFDSAEPVGAIEIVNVDGADAIYFVIGDEDVDDPDVEGDNTYVLPATIGGLPIPCGTRAPTVKLISEGTPSVAVTALYGATLDD